MTLCRDDALPGWRFAGMTLYRKMLHTLMDPVMQNADKHKKLRTFMDPVMLYGINQDDACWDEALPGLRFAGMNLCREDTLPG